ncbi:MAG TPA: hypothetical protein VMK05_13275 [Burkholderiales bacterium]|nr:hypothetical protein [Burkholderiales bacterium]
MRLALGLLALGGSDCQRFLGAPALFRRVQRLGLDLGASLRLRQRLLLGGRARFGGRRSRAFGLLALQQQLRLFLLGADPGLGFRAGAAFGFDPRLHRAQRQLLGGRALAFGAGELGSLARLVQRDQGNLSLGFDKLCRFRERDPFRLGLHHAGRTRIALGPLARSSQLRVLAVGRRARFGFDARALVGLRLDPRRRLGFAFGGDPRLRGIQRIAFRGCARFRGLARRCFGFETLARGFQAAQLGLRAARCLGERLALHLQRGGLRGTRLLFVPGALLRGDRERGFDLAACLGSLRCSGFHAGALARLLGRGTLVLGTQRRSLLRFMLGDFTLAARLLERLLGTQALVGGDLGLLLDGDARACLRERLFLGRDACGRNLGCGAFHLLARNRELLLLHFLFAAQACRSGRLLLRGCAHLRLFGGELLGDHPFARGPAGVVLGFDPRQRSLLQLAFDLDAPVGGVANARLGFRARTRGGRSQLFRLRPALRLGAQVGVGLEPVAQRFRRAPFRLGARAPDGLQVALGFGAHPRFFLCTGLGDAALERRLGGEFLGHPALPGALGRVGLRLCAHLRGIARFALLQLAPTRQLGEADLGPAVRCDLFQRRRIERGAADDLLAGFLDLACLVRGGIVRDFGGTARLLRGGARLLGQFRFGGDALGRPLAGFDFGLRARLGGELGLLVGLGAGAQLGGFLLDCGRERTTRRAGDVFGFNAGIAGGDRFLARLGALLRGCRGGAFRLEAGFGETARAHFGAGSILSSERGLDLGFDPGDGFLDRLQRGFCARRLPRARLRARAATFLLFSCRPAVRLGFAKHRLVRAHRLFPLP